MLGERFEQYFTVENDSVHHIVTFIDCETYEKFSLIFSTLLQKTSQIFLTTLRRYSK